VLPYLSPELINALLEWFSLLSRKNHHHQNGGQQKMMANTPAQEDRSAEDPVAATVSNSIVGYSDD
jgi:hypothetical protein